MYHIYNLLPKFVKPFFRQKFLKNLIPLSVRIGESDADMRAAFRAFFYIQKTGGRR